MERRSIVKLTKLTSEIYVPDGAPVDQALARTTHLGIGAHQDDLEIMAAEGILAGFGNPDRWFGGVIVTDGAGSSRDSLYAEYTDEQMRTVRRVEQKKAAHIGEYGVQVFLEYTSAEVKDPAGTGPVADLRQILDAARPEVVYAHNLADKHPTHVSSALRVIKAIRSLPKEARPRKLYGCEVWRDLDWMVDADKVVFQLDGHESVLASLVGVFDSQIVGGKRYDLATMGRRRAHATYHDSHSVDACQLINFGMDLTPLIEDDAADIQAYVMAYVNRLAGEIAGNLTKHG